MKRTLWFILISTLILVLLPLASQAAPLQKLSWRVEYYNNNNLSGQPVSIRFEDAIDHDWGKGSPGDDISKDNFSARWTLTRHLEKGVYLFFLTADDGARVWLDGELIVDAWSLGRKDRLKTRVYIGETGDHDLQVAYFEKSGDAEIKLDWIVLAGPSGDPLAAWTGEYFSNRDLEGTPDLVRLDGAINFDWNSGAPDPKLTRDNFSVRWTRSIYLNKGRYQFRIQHDDGMRVFIDDNNVYDSWTDQKVSYKTKSVDLEEGHHTFRVEFYDHLGNAVVRFTIDDDPGNYKDIDDDDDGDGSSSRKTRVIDNKSSEFHWGGPQKNRHASSGGHGTGFFWTYNTRSSWVNYGKWKPRNLAAGDYEVFVFIPNANASTGHATYRVWHDGSRTDRTVDQNRFNNVWVSLGTYEFSSNEKEGVVLYDRTNEASGSTRIAFDAVKFVPR